MSESELERTPAMPEATEATQATPAPAPTPNGANGANGETAAAGEPAAEGVRALLERVAGLERELAAERERATDYMQQWQRAQADHANLRRRAQQEQEQLTTALFAQTSALLLPALDSLERAFRTLPETLRHLSWMDGIALVEMQLRRTLEAQGVTPFEPQAGDQLDPARHQAVTQAESARHTEGAIVEVVQRGYEWRGQVLRPALVSIARPPATGASASDAATTASATTSGSGPPGATAPAAPQPGKPEPEAPSGASPGEPASGTTG
ncbi:MAG TPA: nucleotide exchange factor GrpE [Ktedonobacterales bacterium]|nr:nucleotide exchange factor GrpE [Ktedonobacterales bacterium]